MSRKVIMVLMFITIAITGCTNKQQTSSISVAFHNVNGHPYVVTNEAVSNIGKKIDTSDTIYEIAGEDINSEAALQTNNGYVKLVKKEIWCNTPSVKEHSALYKAGGCSAQ